jgi:hypothetical protein
MITKNNPSHREVNILGAGAFLKKLLPPICNNQKKSEIKNPSNRK